MKKSAAFNLGFQHGIKQAEGLRVGQRLGQLGRTIGNSGSMGKQLLELFGKGTSRKAREGLGSAAAGLGGAAGLSALYSGFSPNNDPAEGTYGGRRPARMSGENPNYQRQVMGYI